MLNLRSADDEPKIATGCFLNMSGMVSHTADEAMRYPIQFAEWKVNPKVRREGVFELPVDIPLVELLA
jgi:hypothetical protein